MSGRDCGRAARNRTARGGRASASCRAGRAGHRSPSARVKAARARGVQVAPVAALSALLPAELSPAEVIWVVFLVSQRPPFPLPLRQPLSLPGAVFYAAALSLSQLSPTARVLPRSTRVCGVEMAAIPGSRSRADASSDAAITP